MDYKRILYNLLAVAVVIAVGWYLWSQWNVPSNGVRDTDIINKLETLERNQHDLTVRLDGIAKDLASSQRRVETVERRIASAEAGVAEVAGQLADSQKSLAESAGLIDENERILSAIQSRTKGDTKKPKN